MQMLLACRFKPCVAPGGNPLVGIRSPKGILWSGVDKVGVDLGCGDALVIQQSLDKAEVGTTFQLPRGTRLIPTYQQDLPPMAWGVRGTIGIEGQGRKCSHRFGRREQSCIRQASTSSQCLSGTIAGDTAAREALGQPIREMVEAIVPKQDQLFERFWLMWFAEYVVPNNKYSEQRTKKYALSASLVPFFGKIPIARITARQVEQYETSSDYGGRQQQDRQQPLGDSEYLPQDRLRVVETRTQR